MTEFRLAFECTYCDEVLDVELRDNGQTVVCDEFHRCLGERVGFVASVYDEQVACSGAGDFRVVVRSD